MGGFAQQSESGRVVVKERESQQKACHQPCGPRRQRPEAHLGIELLLEAAVLDDYVGIGGGHGVLSGNKQSASRG
jgi:hypothetical protein